MHVIIFIYVLDLHVLRCDTEYTGMVALGAGDPATGLGPYPAFLFSPFCCLDYVMQ